MTGRIVAAAALAAALGGAAAGAEVRRQPWAVVVFPSGAEFTVEIASDPAARAKGYMGRSSIGPKEGMLFVFERADRHGFWMKNCLVSLDLIWLDEALRVVDVARSLLPCPAEGECPETLPAAPARYVLEVAGGTVERAGLRPGDRIAVLSERPFP